jgi:3-oxoadipate enol-lactonase
MPQVIVPDGTRIHYQRFGRTDGEPLLLIQGLGADSGSWLLQRFPFGGDHRCIAPDNRGAGRSDVPPGPYDLEVMAADLLAVLDAEGIDSTHVVGVSMGGILAQILAVRHPERVRSLVLSCTACHHHRWRIELLEEWAELARTRGMGGFVDHGLRWIVGSRSMRRFWPAMRLFGPVAFDISADAFVAQVEAILATDDTLRGELVDIDVPTLVIVGSQDVLTPLGDSEELAELIPGARLAVVRGGAHGYMVEKAGAFNATVLDFLGEVAGAEQLPRGRVAAAV